MVPICSGYFLAFFLFHLPSILVYTLILFSEAESYTGISVSVHNTRFSSLYISFDISFNMIHASQGPQWV